MRSKEHSKLSNEFQRMILDFWIEKDVRPEWIMRILIETAATYVPKVDEYFENRTDYDKDEAFDRLYEEFDRGDKDLSKADFDEVYQEEK